RSGGARLGDRHGGGQDERTAGELHGRKRLATSVAPRGRIAAYTNAREHHGGTDRETRGGGESPRRRSPARVTRAERAARFSAGMPCTRPRASRCTARRSDQYSRGSRGKHRRVSP